MHNESHSLELLCEHGLGRFPPSAPNAVAVVIPCHRVRQQIGSVLEGIGDEVGIIYVVDDHCPEETGHYVQGKIADPRIRVIYHDTNQGVGGATMTGMRHAFADGAEIVVKIDGDGQMDPRLLPIFVEAIRSGEADYAKGNRFFDPDGLTSMPVPRLLGNAILSFFAKLSTGYWHSFDPNNGYIAIHAEVAARLPFERINRRYFFETDLLFRLNVLRARVVDIPMQAVYGNEVSNLRIRRVILPFLLGHGRNFCKRIVYNYFLRDFSLASLELLLGLPLLIFGIVYGLTNWGFGRHIASPGTVMLAALPVVLGVQFVMAFFAHDIHSVPAETLHRRLVRHRQRIRAIVRETAG